MARYEINGGRQLEGCVTISGAKNAAVAILPEHFLSSVKSSLYILHHFFKLFDQIAEFHQRIIHHG